MLSDITRPSGVASDVARARRRFLLSQRARVELYPPVLHQARLLGKVGTAVTLDAGDTRQLQNRTRPDQPTADWLSRLPQLVHAAEILRYARAYRAELGARPNVAIAYDPEAAALLLQHEPSARAGTLKVVHLHELPIPALYRASRIASLSVSYLLAHLRRADAVIVPDAARAAHVIDTARLCVAPFVVMNCPPLLDCIPNSRLCPLLHEHGLGRAKVVHYQGAVGPHHGLEAVIASMQYWPSDSVFVVVGGGKAVYLDQLKAIAAQHAMLGRVVFAGRVPYDDVMAFAAGASVGVTLLEPSNENWRLAAGASNKRFEYAALGIPQVTNVGPGIDELFCAYGVGAAVDPTDVGAIGRAIAKYLIQPELAGRAGAAARQLHLSKYNYEAQFQPVLEYILEQTVTRAIEHRL